MRTSSLALALLLGGAVSARGDYYRFMYVPCAADCKDMKMPGMAGMKMPGMQMPGMPGMQMPGMPGMQMPGMPGMQMPGMPGFRPKPRPGEKPLAEPDEDDEVDLTSVRHIIVEVKKRQVVKSIGKLMIEHKFGRTTLHKADSISFKRLVDREKRSVIPTTAEKYDLLKKQLLKEKKTGDADKILETAEFCLTNGLFDKFPKEMEDLVEKGPKHPVSIAYKKMKEALKKAPTRPDRSAFWKDRLTGTFKVTTTAHYACLYNSRDEAEVIRRLGRFEENLRAFYYWFALKGITLPALEQRQVVVFLDKPEEFFAIYQAFDAPLREGDGFLARRENLGIFSLTPIDEFYELLSKSSNQHWTVEKWSMPELLAGRFKTGEKPDDSAYMQEIALVLKAMQDECELASITRVGSQQLCGALGLLHGSVSVPLWLQSGLGSFFETPKGAYWPGTAAPHWRYYVNFRNWRDDPRSRENYDDALISTLTDQYFHDARRTNDPGLWEKAQTMSWALTYFLAQDENNRDNFLKYLQALSELPRDMDISPDTHLLCFARAFGLVNEPDPSKIDRGAIRKGVHDFAKTWYVQYMSSIQGGVVDMPDAWDLWRKTQARLMTPGGDQKSCPISGKALGSMGAPVRIMMEGQPLFLCCKGCVDEAREDPKKTLKRVEELKARVKGMAPGNAPGASKP